MYVQISTLDHVQSIITGVKNRSAEDPDREKSNRTGDVKLSPDRGQIQLEVMSRRKENESPGMRCKREESNQKSRT